MKTLLPTAIFSLMHFSLALPPWSPCLQRRGTIDSLNAAYIAISMAGTSISKRSTHLPIRLWGELQELESLSLPLFLL